MNPKYSSDYKEVNKYEAGLAENNGYYISIISLGNEEYGKYIQKALASARKLHRAEAYL